MNMSEPWVSRAMPFGIYMFFIVLHSALKPLVSEEPATAYLTPLLYTIKIGAVTLALAWFWKSYDELDLRSFSFSNFFIGLAAGSCVFILWIHVDWDFATMGKSEVFDPNNLPEKWIYPFIAIRLLGTSVIVPIFEELFWRSFILRYIIHPDFTTVKLGTFTWSSFFISSLLFGAEHQLWLAGIMAGILYNLLLYRTKNLYYCILAHGITNFALGVYVIKTGNWQFW